MSNFYDGWVAFDVETIKNQEEGLGYALQPWRAKYQQAKVRTYAMSWIVDGKLRNSSTSEIDRHKLSRMLLHYAETGKTLLTWKGTFDIAWLCAMGLAEEASRCKWLDVMVVWKNLDRTRKSYSLKNAVREFLPSMAGYEEGVDFAGDVEKLKTYNKQDTDATLLLAIKFWGELTVRERTALLIDMEDLTTLAERNVEGIYIDIEGIKKTASMLQKQRSENYTKLLPYLETVGQFIERGGKITPKELRDRFNFNKLDPEAWRKIENESAINLDSDQKIQKLLFQDWGLPVYKLTDGGKSGNKKPSVDKEALLELAHQDERALWLQQYRETTGLISKCVKSVVESLKYNNPYPGSICEPIVRPEQNKSGTVTDRCTYSSYIDAKF